MKKLKLIYFKYISKQTKSWNYFIHEIFYSDTNCLKVLEDWEKHSFLKFTPQTYSHLLQLSLFKNCHELSIYLLNHRQIVYSFIPINSKEKIVTKNILLDSLMTNNLYVQDHAAWIGLMSFHHPLHLIGLEKNYEQLDYRLVAQTFFNHPTFKHLFKNKERQRVILELCHAKAKEMISYIFLDISLETRIDTINLKPLKI